MDMSMAGPIGTEDLVKDYLLGTEVVHALQGVSVTIQAGEMGTIMGASGVREVHADDHPRLSRHPGRERR
jgi:predicted ABC-type transport system involved in lysophospholipase L1 biosynthesis ATPase subunit